MTFEIPLTHGLVAIVDDDDALLVQGSKWFAKKHSMTTYALRMRRRPDGSRTKQALHQLLTGWAHTDHVNGNGLDNRRSNLRPVTTQQNSRNMRKYRGSSRFKGVSWDKRSMLWRARICVNYKTIWLGLFNNEEDAALAYDAASRIYFGDYAAPNFPKSGERSALR